MTNPRPRQTDTAGRQPISPSDVERERPGPVGSLASESASALKSTESEASVKQVNDLVAFMVDRKIKAVFVESSVSEKNIKALVEGCASRGHHVVIGGELYSDAPGADGTPDATYVGMVKHNVDTIVKALK